MVVDMQKPRSVDFGRGRFYHAVFNQRELAAVPVNDSPTGVGQAGVNAQNAARFAS